MAKVCIGCGLKKDDSGNLIISTSGTQVATGNCKTTNGTKIACGTDGKLYGPPEKFYAQKLVTLDGPDPGNLGQYMNSIDGNKHESGSAKVTFTNPSACLPMSVLITAGIKHCQVEKNSTGPFHALIECEVYITGSLTESFTSGHQIWRYDGSEKMSWDTTGAREYHVRTLPAGGSITVEIRRVTQAFTGSLTLDQFQNLNVDALIQGWN